MPARDGPFKIPEIRYKPTKEPRRTILDPMTGQEKRLSREGNFLARAADLDTTDLAPVGQRPAEHEVYPLLDNPASKSPNTSTEIEI